MKVTIYLSSEFGMGHSAIEGHLLEHGTRKFAQYDDAPYVTFTPKRCRKKRTVQQSYKPSLLIVSGWGKITGLGTVSHGKYRSCDPRWQADFDAWVDGQIASGAVEVVADYRARS